MRSWWRERSGAAAGRTILSSSDFGRTHRRAGAAVGAAIGLFILPRALRLGRESLRILLQHAPVDVDLDAITADLVAIDGVVEVHDLHLWTLTSEMEVLTAHVVTTDATGAHSVLDAAREVLATRHDIAHATLQVEPASHHGCEDVDW